MHHQSPGGKYYTPHINKQEDGTVSFVDDTWGYFDMKIKD